MSPSSPPGPVFARAQVVLPIPAATLAASASSGNRSGSWARGGERAGVSCRSRRASRRSGGPAFPHWIRRHAPDVLAPLADRVMSPQTGTQTLFGHQSGDCVPDRVRRTAWDSRVSTLRTSTHRRLRPKRALAYASLGPGCHPTSWLQRFARIMMSQINGPLASVYLARSSRCALASACLSSAYCAASSGFARK